MFNRSAITTRGGQRSGGSESLLADDYGGEHNGRDQEEDAVDEAWERDSVRPRRSTGTATRRTEIHLRQGRSNLPLSVGITAVLCPWHTHQKLAPKTGRPTRKLAPLPGSITHSQSMFYSLPETDTGKNWKLHVRRVRNRYRFSGAGFWFWFLELCHGHYRQYGGQGIVLVGRRCLLVTLSRREITRKRLKQRRHGTVNIIITDVHFISPLKDYWHTDFSLLCVSTRAWVTRCCLSCYFGCLWILLLRFSLLQWSPSAISAST